MNRRLVAVCGLALAWSPVAHGQSLSDRYAAEIDTNKDGVVSREEFLAMSRNHFARQDKDGDHRLTGAERPRYLAAEPIITEQDYLNIGLKVFDGQDIDHDGSLRGVEVKRFWEQLNQGSPTPRPTHPH